MTLSATNDAARAIAKCRICGGTAFDDVLDLGVQPLANSFLDATALRSIEAGTTVEPKFPLNTVKCTRCHLVTLTHVVDPEVMFKHYVYATGNSSTMRAHFASYAHDVQSRFVPHNGLVVEIGSNDGTLLSAVDTSKARILGVEPAANIAKLATTRGVPTKVAFFNEDTAKEVVAEHGKAHAIIANNVVAHIDDLDSVMRGVDALLHDDGVFVVEAPSLRTLLESKLFDTIYHEHLSYLSATCLASWGARHQLPAFDVRFQQVHGGSLRTFFARPSFGERAKADSSTGRGLDDEIAKERAAGIDSADTYAKFRVDVADVLRSLRSVLEAERAAQRVVWGYAAPAKGNTLLNAANIGRDLLPLIVDKAPLKQGLYAPGSHIAVASPDRLRDVDKPSALCILAWNLADEVRAEQSSFAKAGGRFLVPLPSPRWLT